jgi:hypothetical protein
LKEVPEKGYTLMKLLNATTAGFNNTCISTYPFTTSVQFVNNQCTCVYWNKKKLLEKKILNCDGQQFYQY